MISSLTAFDSRRTTKQHNPGPKTYHTPRALCVRRKKWKSGQPCAFPEFIFEERDMATSSRAFDNSYFEQSFRAILDLAMGSSVLGFVNAAQERRVMCCCVHGFEIEIRGVCDAGTIARDERYLYPVRRRSPRIIPFLTCLEMRPMLISEHVKVA